MTPSAWLIALAVFATANPARVAPALPRGARPAGERALVTVLGAGLATAVLVGLALAGEAIVDGLGVSAPTMRVAAGLALLATGLRDLWVAPPGPDPALTGRAAALVPVAVPLVLRPELGVLAVSAGADVGPAPVALPLVAVVGVLAGLATMDLDGPAARVTRWAARLGGVLVLATGTALTVDGVLSV